MKRVSLNSKAGKYYVARQKGKNKKESAIIAGYNPSNITRIENTQEYKALSYKDELLKQITLDQIAKEQLKVIMQDEDLSSKNTAIKNVMEKIEPEERASEEDERVLVILKG